MHHDSRIGNLTTKQLDHIGALAIWVLGAFVLVFLSFIWK